jgi:tellurite resistance protein TerC
MNRLSRYLYSLPFERAKRIVKTVVGFTVLGIGVAMIALPGPAIVFIPLGLGILAGEYIWARRLLAHVRDRITNNRRPRS